jgi:putative oxidoreductase
LAGVIFLVAGGLKLVGQSLMMQEFDAVGFGQWFRYVTGSPEIGGGAVLTPSYSGLSALSLLVALASLQRDQIRVRLGI